MTNLPAEQRCSRCGGVLRVQLMGTLVCTSCGTSHAPSAPPTSNPKTPRELIVALTECVATYVDQPRYASLLRSIEYRMENEDAERSHPVIENWRSYAANAHPTTRNMFNDMAAVIESLTHETTARKTHIHCSGCEGPVACKGIQSMLPPREPSPEWVLRARAQGRMEFLNLLKEQDPDSFIINCVGDHPIADTGDYGQHWIDKELNEIFRPDDEEYSLIDNISGAYWSQEGRIMELEHAQSPEKTSDARCDHDWWRLTDNEDRCLKCDATRSA